MKFQVGDTLIDHRKDTFNVEVVIKNDALDEYEYKIRNNKTLILSRINKLDFWWFNKVELPDEIFKELLK